MNCSNKILPVKTQLTWENAKEGCKDKFVGPNGGRLFEPMTLAENKLVYDVAKAILNLQHLIRCSSDQILNLQIFFTNSFSGSPEEANICNICYAEKVIKCFCILLLHMLGNLFCVTDVR